MPCCACPCRCACRPGRPAGAAEAASQPEAGYAVHEGLDCISACTMPACCCIAAVAPRPRVCDEKGAQSEDLPLSKQYITWQCVPQEESTAETVILALTRTHPDGTRTALHRLHPSASCAKPHRSCTSQAGLQHPGWHALPNPSASSIHLLLPAGHPGRPALRLQPQGGGGAAAVRRRLWDV